MAQEYNEILPGGATNILQDNIDSRKNDEALRSGFSGSAFPTSPIPIAGQRCYREDLKKEYIFNGEGWVEVASSGAIAQEVTLARGTHTELQNRLSVSMNPDGTLKTPATANVDEFKVSGLEPTYVSTNSFSVPDDLTAIFTQGRVLKITDGAEVKYLSVVSSAFDTVTNVVIDGTITASISAVDYSLAQYGLPNASETVKGVVKVGANINVDEGVVSVPEATDIVKGIVELATPDEVKQGTDNKRAVTPAGFKAAFGEFYPTGLTPTYVDANNFSVTGDQTAIFTKGRVLKITRTGGTVYAVVSASVYDTVTTVTVAGDTIDSGISAVLYAVQQHTSAIWESGSNANGEYVKFADGTMECTQRIEFANSGLSFTQNTSSLNWHAMKDFTFPAEFSEPPKGLSASVKSGAGLGWASVRDATTTTITISIYDDINRTAQSSLCSYTAIGRWY